MLPDRLHKKIKKQAASGSPTAVVSPERPDATDGKVPPGGSPLPGGAAKGKDGAGAPGAAKVSFAPIPDDARRCPSPEEVCNWMQHKYESAREAGVFDLLLLFVLLGLFFYVMNAMIEYLREQLNFEVPSGRTLANSIFAFADTHPMAFLFLNFGIAFVIGTVFLFLETLTEIWHKLRKRTPAQLLAMASKAFVRMVQRVCRCGAPRPAPAQSGYRRLKEQLEGGDGDGDGAPAAAADVEAGAASKAVGGASATADGTAPSVNKLATDKAQLVAASVTTPPASGRDGAGSRDITPSHSTTTTPRSYRSNTSASTTPRTPRAPPTQALLQRELRLVIDKAEELEIKTRVLQKKSAANAPTHALAAELKLELKELHLRRDELMLQLERIDQGGGASRKPDSKAGTPRKAIKASSSKPGYFSRLLRSALVQIIARSANGIFSVGIYFADLISDVQACDLLVPPCPSLSLILPPSNALSSLPTSSRASSRMCRCRSSSLTRATTRGQQWASSFSPSSSSSCTCACSHTSSRPLARHQPSTSLSSSSASPRDCSSSTWYCAAASPNRIICHLTSQLSTHT